MKNYYFGDNRDLFKYDLISFLLEEGQKKSFTYIPMLTKDNENSTAKYRNYKCAVGEKNEKLLSFLKKHSRKEEERNLEKIRDYFKSESIGVNLYKAKGKYFSRKNREAYFQGIPRKLLQSTLIFIDPDIGLEPPIADVEENHLKYGELGRLLEKADASAVFMIFQFRSRVVPASLKPEADEKIGKRTLMTATTHSKRIIDLIGGVRKGAYTYIRDKNIILFFICKDVSYSLALVTLLSKYKQKYPDRLETKEGDETFVEGNVLYDLGDNWSMKGPQKETLWADCAVS